MTLVEKRANRFQTDDDLQNKLHRDQANRRHRPREENPVLANRASSAATKLTPRNVRQQAVMRSPQTDVGYCFLEWVSIYSNLDFVH